MNEWWYILIYSFGPALKSKRISLSLFQFLIAYRTNLVERVEIIILVQYFVGVSYEQRLNIHLFLLWKSIVRFVNFEFLKKNYPNLPNASTNFVIFSNSSGRTYGRCANSSMPSSKDVFCACSWNIFPNRFVFFFVFFREINQSKQNTTPTLRYSSCRGIQSRRVAEWNIFKIVLTSKII